MKVTIEGTKEEIKQFMYDCVKDKMILSVNDLPTCSHSGNYFTHSPSLYEQNGGNKNAE